jgi:hypothetical protein
MALYVLGGLTGRYAYGRLISYVAILLQIAAAGEAARLAGALGTSRRHTLAAAAGTVILVAAIAGNAAHLARSLADWTDWTHMYPFLSRYVGPVDVVLANPDAAYHVPAVTGRVVAHVGPLPLVADVEARKNAVDRFFRPDATTGERLAVIRSYDVRWLLVRSDDRTEAAIADSLGPIGEVVYRDHSWTLVRIAPGAE